MNHETHARRPSWAQGDPLLERYYDDEWGITLHGEPELFERICLESFQAGLSWRTVLAKREAFREVFAGFDPEVVADFDDADVERLCADPRIIRNRAKIRAAITNARAVLALRESGGLDALIWSHRPRDYTAPQREEDLPTFTPESAALAKELKRNGFVFVGPATCWALMQAIGMVDLRGAF